MMNREGTTLALPPERAALTSQRYFTTFANRAQAGSTEHAATRERREATLMLGLWLFIGAVAAYDTYLSIKFQETLRFQELNPIGRWLLEVDGGSVAAFMGCKFLGTSIALGVLQLLYVHWRRIGLTVATVLAGMQGLLAMYLTFG